MSDILADIVRHKRQEIEQAKTARPFEDLVTQLCDAPPVRDFVSQLRLSHPLGVIAEVKKASPSAGVIRDDFHPVDIAKIYAANGASCISVLTDEKFFQGHLNYLYSIRKAVDIPLLRKDFILDRYQIAEARLAGADAVLLIAECLNDDELRDLYQYTRELGMQALVELYDEENLPRVLDLNPHLVGVNNRNLRTFKTDLQHSINLRKQVRETILFVSESGIRTSDDCRRLAKENVNAILVGESLMRADDIGQALRDLRPE
ncbi:MAG: indole-3-glycerol phosphate synthase TrpC [Rubinisphaera brasiliensis]|uniref:Indole-3-glycerol phosphate synthase n=1 Tax=Rubinisphaera brasiliensis (strain ATCC 49424 / DSM 5305 / JCM 21570 / IAM 15109 / NBRC 103401 / IFAM 1448) TaxID=756272 RepID=F0SFB0_RUBBR|nr:indole-3-glycerol phosphate synthase TrpC [Rubinisphaera brasiliensis]ADY58265.1 indole-3-glycerol phosphate synthase [Rubinisphaera brasiliensis DSM 5305]MBR9800960.1 indole-3-glycerol phosphate synthase TrpC [bacterium]